MTAHIIRRLFSTNAFQADHSGWVFILYSIGVGAGADHNRQQPAYIVVRNFSGAWLLPRACFPI